MTPKISEKGFSILELMTVILITSSISAMVVPKFADSLKKSRTKQCSVTRLFTEQASVRYSNDHDGALATIAELTEKNYLDRPPRCTSNGIYAWLMLESGQRVIACSFHGWTVADVDDAPAADPPVAEPPVDPKAQEKAKKAAEKAKKAVEKAKEAAKKAAKKKGK